MFRLFSTWAAMSSATPGLASKFAPIVPTGMRSSRTCSPFASVLVEISRSSGLQRRGRFQLARERRHARLVEAKPVERALIEGLAAAATSRSFAASTSATLFLEHLRRPPERRSDRCVVE